MQKENTKPTQEEKEQYFAAHWGQHVIKDVNNSGVLCTYPVVLSNMYRFEESHLELTSLAHITDEDLDIISCLWINPLAYHLIKPADRFSLVREKIKTAVKTGVWNIEVYQFLQSKGYALSWHTYLVEQLISFGWLKLKQQGGEQDAG